MIGLLVRRLGRGIRQVRFRHPVGPALRFSPRVEPLDGRVLPGGLTGDDFGTGTTPRAEVVHVRVEDPTTQRGSKPGGTTDGVHVWDGLTGSVGTLGSKLGSGTDGVNVWSNSPDPVGTLGSKPGGAGDGVV